MALSDIPAERHRQVAGLFTERVRGTRSWDAPSPVAGWVARDVVRHLTDWFPAFLASGAGLDQMLRSQRPNQNGSRPMKPSSLVWVSASLGTSTRGPYWPEERITCSICSIPPRS